MSTAKNLTTRNLTNNPPHLVHSARSDVPVSCCYSHIVRRIQAFNWYHNWLYLNGIMAVVLPHFTKFGK